MIAAVARNNVIGADGGMPWRLPTDMAHFKRHTMGKPIIMGRKQFESVGKPLPGRANIVVSRQKGYQPEGVLVINDFAAALRHGREIAAADGADELMIIGGGEIYSLGMTFADRLYITHVAAEPAGDTWFPEIDPNRWQVTREETLPVSEKDSAAFVVKTYDRKRAGAH